MRRGNAGRVFGTPPGRRAVYRLMLSLLVDKRTDVANRHIIKTHAII